MKRLCLLCLWLAFMFVAPIASYAISGNFTDPGGGEYWCNVYVSYVSDGKSYSWCTGKDETTEMNNFRGFESEYNATASIEHPTILIKNNNDLRAYLDTKHYKYTYLETDGGHIWRNRRIYMTKFVPLIFK